MKQKTTTMAQAAHRSGRRHQTLSATPISHRFRPEVRHHDNAYKPSSYSVLPVSREFSFFIEMWNSLALLFSVIHQQQKGVSQSVVHIYPMMSNSLVAHEIESREWLHWFHYPASTELSSVGVSLCSNHRYGGGFVLRCCREQVYCQIDYCFCLSHGKSIIALLHDNLSFENHVAIVKSILVFRFYDPFAILGFSC